VEGRERRGGERGEKEREIERERNRKLVTILFKKCMRKKQPS
jgi:hypothetical protein